MLAPLTGLLLVYPVRLNVEYVPIESLGVKALPVFVFLYLAWLLVLLLLAVSLRGTATFEATALVAIFGLVFLGKWLVAGPYAGLRYDGLGNAAHVGYLLRMSERRIPVDQPNLGYFDFPGMHLTVLTVVETTGLGLLRGATLAVLLHLVVLSACVCLLFRNFTGELFLATLGAVVMIQGNIMLARYSLYPGIWALAFLVMFVMFLFGGEGDPLQTRLEWLVLVLLGATAVTHLVTALVLIVVRAGVFLTQSLRASDAATAAGAPRVAILAIFLAVPISWDVYWAARTLKGIVLVTQDVLGNIGERGVLPYYFFNLARAYVGETVPGWAVVVRFVWWWLILVPGTVFGLGELLSRRAVYPVLRRAVGGLVGVLALSAVLTLLSVGGSEFYRLLLYGALFSVPIALHRVRMLSNRCSRWILSGLSILLFVLSLPTFFAHNNLVGTSAYQPWELDAARFARTVFGSGQGWRAFYLSGEDGLMQLAVPNATFASTRQASELKNEGAFFRSVEIILGTFLRSPSTDKQPSRLFYLSERDRFLWRHLLGVDPSAPVWATVLGRLGNSMKLYDNGGVQLYVR